MDASIEMIKMLLPALMVFGAIYYFLRMFFQNEAKRRAMEIRASVRELVTPIQLQAYERVVLLLERIAPYPLIIRVNKNGWSARHLHAELINTVRAEYEHNLSQQIYISAAAWEQVVQAKEETIKIFNIASMKVPENATSNELAQAIIEITSALKKTPSAVAIDLIKKEITQKF